MTRYRRSILSLQACSKPADSLQQPPSTGSAHSVSSAHLAMLQLVWSPCLWILGAPHLGFLLPPKPPSCSDSYCPYFFSFSPASSFGQDSSLSDCQAAGLDQLPTVSVKGRALPHMESIFNHIVPLRLKLLKPYHMFLHN